MLYILDTDHLSLLQRDHLQVTAKVLAASPEVLAITIITAEEQLRGRLSQIRKAHDVQGRTQAYFRLHETLSYLARIQVLDYSREAEAEYQTLRRQKLHIGTQDLRIAAIARSLNAALITRNHTDFSQIPGLTLKIGLDLEVPVLLGCAPYRRLHIRPSPAPAELSRHLRVPTPHELLASRNRSTRGFALL